MSTFKAYSPNSGVITLAAGAALDLRTAAVATGTLSYNIPDYSNWTIVCSTAGAGNAITLPLAAQAGGQTFNIVLGVQTAGANCVILSGAAASANIYGYLIGSATVVACAGVSAINIVSGVATVGAQLQFTCDGSRYYVQGLAPIAASFTTTA